MGPTLHCTYIVAPDLVGTNESLNTEVISDDTRVSLGCSNRKRRRRAQRRGRSVGMARGSSGCCTAEKSIPRLNERGERECEKGIQRWLIAVFVFAHTLQPFPPSTHTTVPPSLHTHYSTSHPPHTLQHLPPSTHTTAPPSLHTHTHTHSSPSPYLHTLPPAPPPPSTHHSSPSLHTYTLANLVHTTGVFLP